MQTNRKTFSATSQRPADIVVNTSTERMDPFQATEHGIPICPPPPQMSPVLALIDDSETVRKILEVCLHRAGYEHVYLFPDGLAFLRWLMTPEAHIPALLIVDLNLPQMDGYSLIRHLKAEPAFAQTIFVILTGRDGMLDKLKGRLSGAHVYLTKPFRTQDILATLRTTLGPLPAQEMAEIAPTLARGFHYKTHSMTYTTDKMKHGE